jgi:hypothetical protein
VSAPSRLVLDCLSPTAVGRGEPAAGVVDHEVEHDRWGLPIVGGRALRGLLRDAWLSMRHAFDWRLEQSAAALLGVEAGDDESILRIGDARVDADTRAAVAAAVEARRVGRAEVLGAVTEIRYQTARRRDGAPEHGSLRATRAISRGVKLEAPLSWLADPPVDVLAVLALTALCTRRVGAHRTRGLGHVRILLDDDLELTRRLARAAVT